MSLGVSERIWALSELNTPVRDVDLTNRAVVPCDTPRDVPSVAHTGPCLPCPRNDLIARLCAYRLFGPRTRLSSTGILRC